MQNNKYVNQVSTLFLRGVLLLLAVPAVAFCTYAAPKAITTDEVDYYRPIVIGMTLSTIPYFYALYQTFKLLNYIDKNRAFSDLSVSAIKKIKYSALVFGVTYALGMPYVYYAAERDDAPGIILIGMAYVFGSCVAAVFAAVLQRLLEDALNIKSENDLTV